MAKYSVIFGEWKDENIVANTVCLVNMLGVLNWGVIPWCSHITAVLTTVNLNMIHWVSSCFVTLYIGPTDLFDLKITVYFTESKTEM